MDKLNQIFDMQIALQIEKMGGHPGSFEIEQKIQFIKDMTLALEDELHEALGEVGWKPWATSKHINREAYLSELTDALHFFVNLCLVINATPYELYEAYVKKNLKNHKRQGEGYDGLSGKCPGCKRALDDPGIGCKRDPEEPSVMIWCQQMRRYYHERDHESLQMRGHDQPAREIVPDAGS